MAFNYFSEDVKGFEIAVGGTNLVKLYSGGTTSVNLVYETGSDVTLKAGLDTGSVIPTNGTRIDEEARLVEFPLRSKDIADGLGTYLLTFTLQPRQGTPGIKEVVVFHEEPIEGFKVSSNLIKYSKQ